MEGLNTKRSAKQGRRDHLKGDTMSRKELS